MIAFDSPLNGNPDIFAIRSDGGGLHRITTSESEDVVPSWSHDGKWIYFASDRSGDFQIWKVSAAAGESAATPAIQVSHGGGFNGLESADGKYLYFNKNRADPALWPSSNAAVWRLSLEAQTGKEEPALESLQDWGWWAPGPKGIFFFEAAGAQRPTVVRLKFLDQKTNRVYDLAASQSLWGT
jgi:Tol biopolymer transport system component